MFFLPFKRLLVSLLALQSVDWGPVGPGSCLVQGWQEEHRDTANVRIRPGAGSGGPGLGQTRDENIGFLNKNRLPPLQEYRHTFSWLCSTSTASSLWRRKRIFSAQQPWVIRKRGAGLLHLFSAKCVFPANPYWWGGRKPTTATAAANSIPAATEPPRTATSPV